MERDYISIERHEHLINEQLQSAASTMQEQFKSARDRLHSELERKLESIEAAHATELKKLRDGSE
jgi:hypothetical protein